MYGGVGFSSVDLSHPELAAVLIHPWHGLLSYHPLYGVAFVAVAIQSWRGGRQRALWSVTLLATIAHIWVQGGWYIWWLGGSTFGMRGMAPAALPLVAGLISLVRRELDTSPGRASLWVWTIALACVWSYPLLLAGNTQFLSWGPLLAAQRPALAAIGALVMAWAYRLATRKSVTAAAVDDECRAATFGLLFAIVAHLAWLFAVIPSPAIRGVKGAVGAALVALLVWSLSQSSQGSPVNRSRSVKEMLRLTLAAAVLALFAAQAALFGRLAVRSERYLASGASPPRPFEYESASPVDELRVTYAEYLEVSGFAQEKAAFRRFLTWQRIDASKLSHSDRQIADTVRQRLLDDSLFGDLLVEATARNGGVVITANGMSEAQQSRARELALGVPGALAVSFSAN